MPTNEEEDTTENPLWRSSPFPSHEWIMPPPHHLLPWVGFASVGAWICLCSPEKLTAWHKVGWGWLRTQDASLGTFLSRREFSCYNSEPHLDPHLPSQKSTYLNKTVVVGFNLDSYAGFVWKENSYSGCCWHQSPLMCRYHWQSYTGTWGQSLLPKSTCMGAPQLPGCARSMNAETDTSPKDSNFLLFSAGYLEWNIKSCVSSITMLKL